MNDSDLEVGMELYKRLMREIYGLIRYFNEHPRVTVKFRHKDG